MPKTTRCQLSLTQEPLWVSKIPIRVHCLPVWDRVTFTLVGVNADPILNNLVIFQVLVSVVDVDVPRARQHVRICAEGRLRAQSPMRRSAGPTGRWHGNVRGSATSATQPIQLPTHSNRSPPPTAQIGPKLGRNIEHWWYDGSPVNRSAAIPRSQAISQHIY